MQRVNVLFLFATLFLSTQLQAKMPLWSYDPGPSPDTKMGKELIDITANIPNMPLVSKQIIGRKQKFRPAFGPIPWRMLPDEGKVKILFIGQDGTHIAEAAGRPATAGFGGRTQDLANYFGVAEGAAFINSYSFTIKGQYGVYNTPYIYKKSSGASVRLSNLVDNKLWLISQNLNSPIVKWRNQLIDWIIRNNKQSMKLIVLFGGAARDSIATYARSKGASVEAYNEDKMKDIQVPETKVEYAGANNTYSSLVARDGSDLYENVLGEYVDYSKSSNQRKVERSLANNLEDYLDKMVFTKGGPYNNGLINAAQLGGYDLRKMMIDGAYTRSLKGLKLDDGSVIENDLIVISLPHPSSLTRTVREAKTWAIGELKASERVMSNVKDLDIYAEKGWSIKADPGKINYYSKGENYKYGRSDIGPEFYDFGTPKNRMVSKSTARRMSGNAHVVIIGTRDNGRFSKSAIQKMTSAKAAEGIDQSNLFIARPSSLDLRYVFDPGPGEKFAKLMVENLDLKKIFDEKEEMSWKSDGIDAYNVKTHPNVAAFGHYRGTFKNPRVLILADPIGYDDIVTARALTGERGQYLHGLMEDMGVSDQYLVFKTIPFGMDGATKQEWATVLAQTSQYRQRVLGEVLKQGKPEVIIADGPNAFSEATRILGKSGVPIIRLRRGMGNGSYGIKAAAKKMKQIEAFSDKSATGNIQNIPRSHLSFYARVWEGTSGDRAITSAGTEYKGIAFAEVVPSWAYEQDTQTFIDSFDPIEMIKVLQDNDLPLPYESIPEFIERLELDPSMGSTQLPELEWAYSAA
ncbi:MAG: hypothetical protein HOE90_05730 [Bacteriovoracaceae bacterium]|jgi:hypothetical protein|nr:hypothetical protein [Bacteriovoracaceae bacterium]